MGLESDLIFSSQLSTYRVFGGAGVVVSGNDVIVVVDVVVVFFFLLPLPLLPPLARFMIQIDKTSLTCFT